MQLMSVYILKGSSVDTSEQSNQINTEPISIYCRSTMLQFQNVQLEQTSVFIQSVIVLYFCFFVVLYVQSGRQPRNVNLI